MKKQLLRIIFFIGIITLFLILNILLQTDNGTFLHESEFTTFENKLLKPEDIENEIGLTETVTGVTHSYWDESDYSRVRTSYYDIELEDGKVYGIYGENLTYAFDLYINGELIASKGKVGDSEKTSFPQTGSFTAYFTAKAVNRIVVRRCNFVHSKWNNFGIYLGPMNVISRYADIRKIESIILVVIILTMSLVNLGIFVGLNGQKRFLFFSFVCLSFMINLLFADPKPIMILIPELNWFVGHKIESCSLITAAFFFILFLEECLEKFGKIIRIITFAILGLAFAYYMVLPSMIYSRYSVPVMDTILGYAFILYLIIFVRAMKHFANLKIEQKYYLVSVVLLLISAVLGVLKAGPATDIMKAALVFSDIILLLGLASEYKRTSESLEQAVRNEDLLRKMNEDKERTLNLQKNFLTIMNHEMRTPLTVIAGYADKLKIKTSSENCTDEDAIKSLSFIKEEALRLGRIVEQSEGGILGENERVEKTVISVKALYEDVARFCTPICEKRHSTIEMNCTENTNIYGNRDEMLQLFYNLVINASRHTEKGFILLKAEESSDSERKHIILTVSDNGEGMDDEDIKHAFEKGFTKDGGKGLGLALCKDIVARHNGSIRIEKNAGKGISVYILLPDICLK